MLCSRTLDLHDFLVQMIVKWDLCSFFTVGIIHGFYHGLVLLNLCCNEPDAETTEQLIHASSRLQHVIVLNPWLLP